MGWSMCRDALCDISAYGGWPGGREHAIFRVGFSALALQLMAMIGGRMVLLSSAAPLEVRRPSICCSRSPLCVAGCSGASSTIFLLPMAFIPFYVSALHFISAFFVFVLLAVAEAHDALMQWRIMRPAEGALSRRSLCLMIWNCVFSVGGVLCFVGWIVGSAFGGLTEAEWIAATMPFFYFLPWIPQVRWLSGLASERDWGRFLAAHSSQEVDGSHSRQDIVGPAIMMRDATTVTGDSKTSVATEGLAHGAASAGAPEVASVPTPARA